MGSDVSNTKIYFRSVTPALSAVEWREHKLSLEDRIQEKGSFSGRPRPDLDKAWHDLLNAENIDIEPEYMRHLGRENNGIAAPDGNSYLSTLNIYHKIHCLNRIKQFMCPDYYFPGS
ncbi:Putative mycotoxin biosynthesis protein UstYa [Colletotrichum destructivum]|uniref:Mycotoxin biosynthesis protein UstYa n=1 Tax=Colletotrichum destructivum TaxID=34406 RepID=A0AAX4J436_9PEZI|nr:Putative mycotoxin biosynthesis protein UstYa [Colletotrichum destructivum]